MYRMDTEKADNIVTDEGACAENFPRDVDLKSEELLLLQEIKYMCRDNQDDDINIPGPKKTSASLTSRSDEHTVMTPIEEAKLILKNIEDELKDLEDDQATDDEYKMGIIDCLQGAQRSMKKYIDHQVAITKNEKDSDKKKIQQFLEEKIHQILEEKEELRFEQKASTEELSDESTHSSPLENRIVEANTESQTRIQELELENQRLRRMLGEVVVHSPEFEDTDPVLI